MTIDSASSARECLRLRDSLNVDNIHPHKKEYLGNRNEGNVYCLYPYDPDRKVHQTHLNFVLGKDRNSCHIHQNS